MEKLAVIVSRLVKAYESYEGKLNREVEKELIKTLRDIPYVVGIERVSVFSDSKGISEPKP